MFDDRRFYRERPDGFLPMCIHGEQQGEEMKRKWTLKRRPRRRQAPDDSWVPKIEAEFIKKRDNDGNCSYCGSPLKPGGWHWMYDEFGQMVRKCNNEGYCRRHRTERNEESFRKAICLYGSYVRR